MSKMIMKLDKRLEKIETRTTYNTAQDAAIDIDELNENLEILTKNVKLLDTNLRTLRNNIDITAESQDMTTKKQDELIS